MACYSKRFDDFTITDGTHITMMHDLKLIPYTIVDCLGKNMVSGIVFDESGQGDTISTGLKLFGLANHGATLMTDGGSAYPVAAEQAGMKHILCTQHFQ